MDARMRPPQANAAGSSDDRRCADRRWRPGRCDNCQWRQHENSGGQHDRQHRLVPGDFGRNDEWRQLRRNARRRTRVESGVGMITRGARACRCLGRLGMIVFDRRRVHGVCTAVMGHGVGSPVLHSVGERRDGPGQTGREADDPGEDAEDRVAGHVSQYSR
jgi:hypothetical protein